MPKYHLNRIDREIRYQNQLRLILKNGKYTSIALCRNNEPYIVTMNYGYDEQKNALYFHNALKGLKLDFIRQNPDVCATVIEDMGYVMGQCSHKYRSVVLWGQMSIVEDLPEKKHAMHILIHHLEQHPEPVKERNLKDNRVYDTLGIMRLDITEMTGKENGN